MYTILIEHEKTAMHRDEFLQKMHEQGIGTGVHYLSIPEHSYYQKRFGWDPSEWPVSTQIGRQTVSLPLSAKMNMDDAHDVLEAISRIFKG